MDRATPIEDHRPLWQQLAAREKEGTDTPPNDLARGAQAILRAVDADTPPERLMLGSDGLNQTRAKLGNLTIGQRLVCRETRVITSCLALLGSSPARVRWFEGLHPRDLNGACGLGVVVVRWAAMAAPVATR